YSQREGETSEPPPPKIYPLRGKERSKLAKKEKETKVTEAQTTEKKIVTPKDLAEELRQAGAPEITPYKVRVYLRSLERYQDGKYTRYKFEEGSELLHQIREGLRAKYLPKQEEEEAAEEAASYPGRGASAPPFSSGLRQRSSEERADSFFPFGS